jgi:Zn-dependent protease with chaperone function
MIREGQVRRLRCSGFVCILAAILTGVPSGLAQDDDARRQVLFNGQVQVPAGKRYVLAFTTRSNFKNARIAGSVQARGGSGNDIRVFVARGQSLVYDSGQRRSVVMSVDFSEPGQYVLVFDNSFSMVSPKIVAGTISLVHWGVDAEQNEADKEEATAHYSQASGTIQRLYAALKADERVWGTTQLFAVPTIRLNNESSINAVANWTTNSIQVNRGLFQLTDRAGEKGEDVLAATLAHEMSHIFYRHPGYGSSGQGVKGLFDELRGVTALDRVQEKEADILGIRVACQAGFDPQGMLILMRVFAQLDSSASSFMKNHPAAVERYNYLQGEATKCQNLYSQGPVPGETAAPPPLSAASPAASSGEAMWKLTQNPNSRWKFKISAQFLYGEHVYPEERRKLGDFDTVDVKREGSGYVGAQRERTAFKIKDSSPQGFHYKACQWQFAVELTSVTEDRIEGRWESYPRDSTLNPLTCERSGERFWEDVAWIRE